MINYRVHPADNFSEIINPMIDDAPEVTPYRWGDPGNEDREETFMTFEPAPMRVRLDGVKKAKSAKPKSRGSTKTST